MSLRCILTCSALLLASVSAACGDATVKTPPAGPPPEAPAQAPAAEPTSLSDHGLAEVADLVFELTNEVRKQKGLSPLEPHPALAQAARSHSLTLAEEQALSHRSDDGSTLRERLPDDFNPRAVGENLWGGSPSNMDSVTLAKRIFAGWMESPSHRRNIESGDYAYLGVGVAMSGEELRAVQAFASE